MQIFIEPSIKFTKQRQWICPCTRNNYEAAAISDQPRITIEDVPFIWINKSQNYSLLLTNWNSAAAAPPTAG